MADPAAAMTGFHGKLPSAGDFVTRGLPTGFARFWDAWAAQHLAGRTGWPDRGLRLRLVSGGRVAAGVVVPGADRVGRRFPLAAFVIAPALPAPEGLTEWGDAAALLLVGAGQGGVDPDALQDQLETLPPPTGEGQGGAMQLWRAGEQVHPCDPAAPKAVLDQLFSCSESSSL